MTDTDNPITVIARATVAIESAPAPEQIAAALGALDTLAQWLADAQAMFNAAIRPHLLNGPITVGTTLLKLAKTRSVVCKDVAAAVERLLTESGGDIKAFCDGLSSNPVKQGGFKQMVGDEEWAKYFEVKWGDKVEIIKLDTRFIRQD